MDKEFIEMERELILDEIQHINNMIGDLQYRVMLLNQKYTALGNMLGELENNP